ncbi:hypothetical protein PsorP6_017600 [Peronosclerospora sorghi]|uniref:Uncharacterized protein n=1 Tax=Peronosclerospora sorghi TaxID=230839 RepID=A0ACC0WN98_9STRA|nr:hypothetical protein PsorP6_017600 [Peronosclerospora sorghi]
MKLQLILAIVICTRSVLAKSTTEVVKHMPLSNATQDTSPVSRNLMPVTFAERWAETVDEGIREAFGAYEREASLDPKVTQSSPWKDLNMFRRLGFYREVVQKNMPPENVFKELKNHHNRDLARLVKIINIGKRSIYAEVRSYASKVEELLINQWKKASDMYADSLYRHLELDKLKSEKELYVNPAFATWLKFVKETYPDAWQKKAARVLQHFYAPGRLAGSQWKTLPEVNQLLEKWAIVLQKSEKWHEIVTEDTQIL